MNTGLTLFIGWLFCAVVMMILYTIQLKKQDATIVDVGWSLLIGLLACFYALSIQIHTLQQWMVLCLVCVWSFRLTAYLWMNRVMGNKAEDGRYQTIRQNRGNQAQIFFALFFQAQALIALLFSIPVWVALQNPVEHLSISGGIGIFIGFGAILGEALADRQLAAFRSRSDNKGKTCRTGLWGVSRHPNYFFEWLHWFAYIFFAYPSPYWWITWGGPLIMLLFLFRLTGIPYTEKQARLSRGEDYEHYQQSVSVFIPWFPKRISR